MDSQGARERAKKLIRESPLGADDQKFWEEHSKTLSAIQLAFFADVIEDDPSLLPYITENLKKKIAAGRDPEKIRAVVAEEEAQLQKFLGHV